MKTRCYISTVNILLANFRKRIAYYYKIILSMMLMLLTVNSNILTMCAVFRDVNVLLNGKKILIK